MISEKIYRFLATVEFLFRVFIEGADNPFKKVNCDITKKIVIIANGPSSKSFFAELAYNNFPTCDFSVINDFVHNPLFKKLKPIHYTLSDPMFFVDTPQRERGLSVITKLSEEVDWPMYLYVRRSFKKAEFLKYIKSNKNITIIYYHHPKYDGFAKFRNFFFKKGWGNGEYSTVVINSIYEALTTGYRNIELYGVDHTFFEGLSVNRDNIPCYTYRHNYDDVIEKKPIKFTYDFSRDYMDMTMFLWEKYDVFRGHKYMASYANYLNAQILNCTENSLIDAYPRK